MADGLRTCARGTPRHRHETLRLSKGPDETPDETRRLSKGPDETPDETRRLLPRALQRSPHTSRALLGVSWKGHRLGLAWQWPGSAVQVRLWRQGVEDPNVAMIMSHEQQAWICARWGHSQSVSRTMLALRRAPTHGGLPPWARQGLLLCQSDGPDRTRHTPRSLVKSLVRTSRIV